MERTDKIILKANRADICSIVSDAIIANSVLEGKAITVDSRQVIPDSVIEIEIITAESIQVTL